MPYSAFAAAVIAAHSIWVLFMLYGFAMTFYTLFFSADKKFLDRWLLRSFHLAGIAFTSILEATGNYCPLTLLENFLNARAGSAAYSGAFIRHYLEKFVYPDVNPCLLIGGAVFIAVFSLAVFIIRPPEKIKQFFTKKPA